DALEPNQIKTKVVFKANQDVWVRYQVDDRTVMKFILREGKYLVLKAQEVIRFQTSDQAGLSFRYRGWEYKPLSQLSEVKKIEGTATVIFPFEKASSIEKPFVQAGPLPQVVSPPASAVSQ